MSPAAMGWAVETVGGRAESLHRFVPPGEAVPTVRVLQIERATMVLGSSQPESDLDLEAMAGADVDLSRRRSGGGAVLLMPGEHVWIDFWVPAGDGLSNPDVVRAAGWVGLVWASAARALGVGAVTVHDGPAERTEWSARVCFAGPGPGEVFAAGRKLVGLSQRRTREWTRIQTMVHRRWDAGATFGLLAGDPAALSAAALHWQDGVAEITGDVIGEVLTALPPSS